MAHAAGCAWSRCGDGRGGSVPSVSERDSRHGRRRVPHVDYDLPRLRPHLRGPAPLDDQFQGVTVVLGGAKSAEQVAAAGRFTLGAAGPALTSLAPRPRTIRFPDTTSTPF